MMNCFIFSLVSAVVLLGSGSCFTIKQNSTDDKSSVVGGGPAGIMVTYHVAFRCNNSYFCGGALITPQHVLTAAHCVVYMQKQKCVVTAHAGSNHKYIDVIPPVYVTTAQIHHQFIPSPPGDERASEHDIGVVKLSSPFSSNQIVPILLNTFPPVNNEMIIITGFGGTGVNSDGNILKQFSSNLLTYPECFKRMDPYDPRYIVFPSDVCDSGKPYEGTCWGDSGSPVINANGLLIGVVSRGKTCASTNLPNIFPSVYYNMEFISSSLAQM